jgi:deoxyribonuclease-4
MAEQQHSLLLGAHMSIAGGFEQAIIRGESIDCTTIQIFTKSNRQWQAKEITQEQVDLFKSTRKKSTIFGPIFAHATYLINIGSSEPTLNNNSAHALAIELDRCHMLGIDYLVLHPGSATNSTEAECLQRISDTLNEVLGQYKGSTMLLLENMAGQGSVACSRFEQLATVFKNIEHKTKVGFCFDTCHAFAAGYDLRTPDAYKKTWDEFDALLGLKHLKAIHINDSKKALGSRVDRHEDIGKGLMGLEAFRLLFNDPKLFDVPKLLETPPGELPDYARNMQVIYELISEKTKKTLNMK